MAALAASRQTPRRDGHVRSFGVSATTQCYAGGLAVLSGGYAEPGTVATGLVAVGVFRADALGGVADGDVKVEVERGVFRFANSASADEIAADDIGKDCYVVDDQTVALTDGSSTRSKAGVVFDVDALGVWVEIV